MKIFRLTSLLPHMPLLSSPKVRLRHGRQHAHFSPDSDPKSAYSLLLSVASSSSHNFPNCLSPGEKVSVDADYLRFRFSVPQPKALYSRARCYFSELCRATCSKEFHFSFCSPFFPMNFSRPTNFPSYTTTNRDKVSYPMIKHLPCSGMHFLLHIFDLS